MVTPLKLCVYKQNWCQNIVILQIPGNIGVILSYNRFLTLPQTVPSPQPNLYNRDNLVWARRNYSKKILLKNVTCWKILRTKKLCYPLHIVEALGILSTQSVYAKVMLPVFITNTVELIRKSLSLISQSVDEWVLASQYVLQFCYGPCCLWQKVTENKKVLTLILLGYFLKHILLRDFLHGIQYTLANMHVTHS